jgi:hypothetical protein
VYQPQGGRVEEGRCHINGKPVSRMLIDGGAAINLMSYSIFKKLRREDGELVKTNLTLNGVGGNPMEARGVISMKLTIGSKSLATTSLSSRCKVTTVLFLVVIRFMPTSAFLLLCVNS